MAKLPWMKFYAADYLLDTQPLSPATRGIWMDMICLLWRADSRGSLTYPIETWCRHLRCDLKTWEEARDELRDFAICDVVTNGNGDVTVRSRRLVREEKARKSVRIRVQRFRRNGGSNAPVRDCNREKSESEVRIRSQNQKSEKNEEEKKSASCLAQLDALHVSPALAAWALAEGIDRPEQYLPEFVDYWRSVGGRKRNGQCVRDWAASFRNHLRRLKAEGKLRTAVNWREQFLAQEASA